ncbi:SDR family NAD(P)-dependent oxidoreductase [Schlesneria paludicola]|uniref:SDR family NAD(P)-dependent oxidoreductase n=1 Tax=Schlesneria paludicola TaxID=360056 RepID=UPI00029AF97A|nr:SDR family NAD(P)-dependent oxidoreductase [Schlesneria paludicola]
MTPFSQTRFDLTGRAALVTGAGGGIGQAAAVSLAAAGAVVGIHFRSNDAGAQATLAAIEAAGGRGVLLQGDLTREDDANRVVDQFVQQIGRLDVLFNNAGDPLTRSSLEQCPTDLWMHAFQVNVHSAFLITRRAIPHLKASGRGSIINNLSLSVQTGGSGGAGPYAAAKGALQVFTRTLSRELAPLVRANCIMPGVVETRHHELFSTPEKMEDYRRQTPLARNSTSDEIAQSVLFLASDASSFMTGGVIDLNGGRFLR